jgi:hypothetical protein
MTRRSLLLGLLAALLLAAACCTNAAVPEPHAPARRVPCLTW